MPPSNPQKPMTIRASEKTVRELDALAKTMERTRSFVIQQALDDYLAKNAWQLKRIEAGVKAARSGRVKPAEAAFKRIGAKHGWKT